MRRHRRGQETTNFSQRGINPADRLARRRRAEIVHRLSLTELSGLSNEIELFLYLVAVLGPGLIEKRNPELVKIHIVFVPFSDQVHRARRQTVFLGPYLSDIELGIFR